MLQAFNVFMSQCFKYIIKACDIIWSEYNENKIFKNPF